MRIKASDSGVGFTSEREFLSFRCNLFRQISYSCNLKRRTIEWSQRPSLTVVALKVFSVFGMEAAMVLVSARSSVRFMIVIALLVSTATAQRGRIHGFRARLPAVRLPPEHQPPPQTQVQSQSLFPAKSCCRAAERCLSQSPLSASAMGQCGVKVMPTQKGSLNSSSA